MVSSMPYIRCIQTDWSPQGLSYDCIWHVSENRFHQKEEEEVKRNGGGLCQVDDKTVTRILPLSFLIFVIHLAQPNSFPFNFLILFLILVTVLTVSERTTFPSAHSTWTGKTLWENTNRKPPSPLIGQRLSAVHQRLPLLVLNWKLSSLVGCTEMSDWTFPITRGALHQNVEGKVNRLKVWAPRTLRFLFKHFTGLPHF